jgi:hypothetical protein
MASILRVNTLTDASSNNSVPMATVASGSAKSWSTSNTDGSAVLDSFNLSSLGDTATGKETRNFTNNMVNNDYSAVALTGTGDNNGNHHPLLNNTVATDSYQVWAFDQTTLTDNPIASTVNGDLA